MAMVSDHIEKTEALVRTWEITTDALSPPPVPARHPARLAAVDETAGVRRPPLPQRNPTRLSIDIGKAYGIPSSPYAASSVYSSAPPSPVTEFGETAYYSHHYYSSDASDTSSRSHSHSRRNSLGRRLPAKTIAEIRAKIELLKPRIDEFREKVDEIRLRNENAYSSGMHEIRILRNYGTPEMLRWQEFC